MSAALDQLWAGWRSTYIETVSTNRSVIEGGLDADRDSAARDQSGKSLFERILELSDHDGYVVHRSGQCSVVLNAYPYTNGHVLVLPDKACSDLADLAVGTHDELWREVRDAVAAIRLAYRCDGVNVGMNIGTAAGAGVPEHLHVHCLPRWAGDTNFMTSVANTRVMPETLSESWKKLRDAWPN